MIQYSTDIFIFNPGHKVAVFAQLGTGLSNRCSGEPSQFTTQQYTTVHCNSPMKFWDISWARLECHFGTPINVLIITMLTSYFAILSLNDWSIDMVGDGVHQFQMRSIHIVAYKAVSSELISQLVGYRCTPIAHI